MPCLHPAIDAGPKPGIQRRAQTRHRNVAGHAFGRGQHQAARLEKRLHQGCGHVQENRAALQFVQLEIRQDIGHTIDRQRHPALPPRILPGEPRLIDPDIDLVGIRHVTFLAAGLHQRHPLRRRSGAGKAQPGFRQAGRPEDQRTVIRAAALPDPNRCLSRDRTERKQGQDPQYAQPGGEIFCASRCHGSLLFWPDPTSLR